MARSAAHLCRAPRRRAGRQLRYRGTPRFPRSTCCPARKARTQDARGIRRQFSGNHAPDAAHCRPGALADKRPKLVDLEKLAEDVPSTLRIDW